MKTVQSKTIEEKVDEVLHVKDVEINGKTYSLDIRNKDGRLTLDFNGGDYEVTIDDGGIKFYRNVFRPNHDHDDKESLQKVVNSKNAFAKRGEMSWRSRFPYRGEGYDFFSVPFGSIRVNY
jgi:hypothetical protein